MRSKSAQLIFCVVTVADLQACDPLGTGYQTSGTANLIRKVEKLDLNHVKSLFATKKLAFSTATIMWVWGFVGLGYPLYNAFLRKFLQTLILKYTP